MPCLDRSAEISAGRVFDARIFASPSGMVRSSGILKTGDEAEDDTSAVRAYTALGYEGIGDGALVLLR
jgi:hypothetical protein